MSSRIPLWCRAVDGAAARSGFIAQPRDSGDFVQVTRIWSCPQNTSVLVVDEQPARRRRPACCFNDLLPAFRAWPNDPVMWAGSYLVTVRFERCEFVHWGSVRFGLPKIPTAGGQLSVRPLEAVSGCGIEALRRTRLRSFSRRADQG